MEFLRAGRAAPRNFLRASPNKIPRSSLARMRKTPSFPTLFTQFYIIFLIGFLHLHS